jgi:predicted metal-dependent enzyme (double-stranded beta helix superfamily)
VWLLSWLPGQGTDLHDHGPASGAFAVAMGTLTERALTRGNAVEISRHLTAGRVRAFGPSYVHQVTNTSSMPAVSVHVYTPGLATMNTYCVAPEGLVHKSVEQAGADW